MYGIVRRENPHAGIGENESGWINQDRYGTEFQKVGNKLLGFIRRDNTNLVIDVSGVNEMVIAEVNNQGINWRNNQISSPEMRWIVESTRNKMGVSL